MKRHILSALCAFFGATAAFAQTTPGNSTLLFTTMSSSATITMRPVIMTFAPLPPRAPFTLPTGTHVQFVIPMDNLSNPTVVWYKDGKALSVTGTVLDIPTATAADNGAYSAIATSQGSSSLSISYDTARVLISKGGQRLLNLSTLARISANQPTLVSGFVIEPGPASTMLLVRAVGPALGQFGISDPLAAPRVRLLDPARNVQPPLQSVPVEGVTIYPTTDEAAALVGAFPLPSGSKDVAQLYLLNQGAHSIEVSSADGGAGATLVEVYEVPLAMQ